MKLLFSYMLLLSFFAPSADAASEVQSAQPSASAPKNQLSSAEVNKLQNFSWLIDNDRIGQEYGQSDVIPWLEELSEKYPHCKNFFLDDDKKLGPLAKTMAKLIGQDLYLEKEKSIFYKPLPDILDKDICPNFENFSAIKRIAFHTYAFEILAFFETTCEPVKKNHADDVPNGPAVGLYQLEYAKDIRSWRGKNCQVSEKEIMTPGGNSACAVDVMKGLIKRTGRFFGFSDANGKRRIQYWHALNPSRKAAQNEDPNYIYNRYRRYLSRFPGCKS